MSSLFERRRKPLHTGKTSLTSVQTLEGGRLRFAISGMHVFDTSYLDMFADPVTGQRRTRTTGLELGGRSKKKSKRVLRYSTKPQGKAVFMTAATTSRHNSRKTPRSERCAVVQVEVPSRGRAVELDSPNTNIHLDLFRGSHCMLHVVARNVHKKNCIAPVTDCFFGGSGVKWAILNILKLKKITKPRTLESKVIHGKTSQNFTSHCPLPSSERGRAPYVATGRKMTGRAGW